MLIIGVILATILGRRKGSICNAIFMFIGAAGLTMVYSKSDTTQFKFFTILVFVFGIGAGGEYPVASVSASEKAETNRIKSN